MQWLELAVQLLIEVEALLAACAIYPQIFERKTQS